MGRLLLCKDKQQQLSARRRSSCRWEHEMEPRSVQGPQKRKVESVCDPRPCCWGWRRRRVHPDRGRDSASKGGKLM